MVVLFPFQNHPHPSPSVVGLDSAKWVLPIALARDLLRAKGRARYGKLVGTSLRAASALTPLLDGTELDGAMHNRPDRRGPCALTQLLRRLHHGILFVRRSTHPLFGTVCVR